MLFCVLTQLKSNFIDHLAIKGEMIDAWRRFGMKNGSRSQGTVFFAHALWIGARLLVISCSGLMSIHPDQMKGRSHDQQNFTS